MKLSDISWDMVRMVSINDRTLRLTTKMGIWTYKFETAEQLSEALLILSLQSTKKADLVDEARFNPARFLDCYKRDRDLSLTGTE